MTDPRCNCEEPDCPICTAPAHRPWQPKAGVSSPSPPEGLHPMQAFIWELQQAQLDHYSKTAQARRYVLALLLSFLGGMIGGMASALTILHYID